MVITAMTSVYVTLIIKGKMKFSQVLEIYKEGVRKALIDSDLEDLTKE